MEYTRALELFLSVAVNDHLPAQQRERCRIAFGALMTKAENLKKQIKASQSSSSDPTSSIEASDSPSKRCYNQEWKDLSIKEQTILLKSSKINYAKYPPLMPDTQPAVAVIGPELFKLSPLPCLMFKLILYRDPYGYLPLSTSQESQLGQWNRPHEFLDNPSLTDRPGDAGMYLVQDVITDCSVVASLCAAAAWEFKHNSRVNFSFVPG